MSKHHRPSFHNKPSPAQPEVPLTEEELSTSDISSEESEIPLMEQDTVEESVVKVDQTDSDLPIIEEPEETPEVDLSSVPDPSKAGDVLILGMDKEELGKLLDQKRKY